MTSSLQGSRHRSAACLLLAALSTSALACNNTYVQNPEELFGGNNSQVFVVLSIPPDEVAAALDVSPTLMVVTRIDEQPATRTNLLCRDDEAVDLARVESEFQPVTEDEPVISVTPGEFEGCDRDHDFVAELVAVDVEERCPQRADPDIDDFPQRQLTETVARFATFIDRDETLCDETLPMLLSRALGTAELPWARREFVAGDADDS